MKKVLALLLSVIMTASCFAAYADEVVPGGGSGAGSTVETPGGEGEGSGEVATYTVKISGAEHCTVKIGDEDVVEKAFDENSDVTVTATPENGYGFVKWVELVTGEDETVTENKLSTDAAYSFKVTKDITLKPVVAEVEIPIIYTMSISGSAIVGEKLTAVITPALEESVKVEYSWYVLDTEDAERKEPVADVTGNEFTVTDAMKGKFIAVSATVNDELISAISAKVEEKPAEKAAYEINYEKEKITYDEKVYVVSTSAAVKNKIASGKTIKPGTTYYIAKLHDDESAIEESEWEEIVLDKRPSAPLKSSFTITKASTSSKKDGKIGGFTSKMEYRNANASSWITPEEKIETKLASGSYEIRYKASNEEKFFASSVCTVTIDYKSTSSSSSGSSGSTTYRTNNGVVSTTTTTNGNTNLNPNNNVKKATFGDIEAHWAKGSIVRAVSEGLFNGIDEDTFQPDGLTTRGMIITVLARMAGAKLDGYAQSIFSDVSISDYFGKAAAWGKDKGIINGLDNGAFDPNASLTREQIAAILYRFAQFENKDTSVSKDISGFTDNAEVSDYAKPALEWATAMSVINGRDGNVLAPKGTATRAEIATMLMRFKDNVK